MAPSLLNAIILSSILPILSPSRFRSTNLPESIDSLKPTFAKFDDNPSDYYWIASSPSWIDRSACRWLGVCGLSHVNSVKYKPSSGEPTPTTHSNFPSSLGQRLANVSTKFITQRTGQHVFVNRDQVNLNIRDNGNVNRTSATASDPRGNSIPDYVWVYAPFLHLSNEEEFWPSTVQSHLEHTTPYLDYEPMPVEFQNMTVNNLANLNGLTTNNSVYLQSNDNVELKSPWLLSRENIPLVGTRMINSSDFTVNPENASQIPGYSGATAFLIAAPKADGVVDAFWFYFYSYNQGNRVLGIRFGDHVGDWEHVVVRFVNGQPTQVFLSAHENGKAYDYSVISKYGVRPIVYSAQGSHAHYATVGDHSYVLPLNLLKDHTDAGPLWDATLNVQSYIFNSADASITPSDNNPDLPTSWLDFNGRWGDKTYLLNDKRQYRLAGQYHYVSGPFGPKYHRLDRKNVCQIEDDCTILDKLIEEPM